MTEADGRENENGAESQGSPEQPGEAKLEYGIIPQLDEEPEAHFVSSKPQSEADVPAVEPPAAALRKSLPLLAGAAVFAALIAGLVAITINHHTTPPSYNNLGGSNNSDAGLAGLLVLDWLGKPGYQLQITPASPQQLASFQAVVNNPPHPISVTIRLMGSLSVLYCQKEILLPVNPAPTAAPSLSPQTTPAGDTVQYVAGADGEIGEIDLRGDLACPEESFSKINSWSFATNFPTLDEQADILNHRSRVASAERQAAQAHSNLAGIHTLPAPIEGDDVITADASAHGVVETRAGRVFILDGNGSLAGVFGWTAFPMAIHFRCDKNAACILTRAGSSKLIRARLRR